MHDDTTVQRFIELRASGATYARLMAELNVSKPTLIAWSRKYWFQIHNLRTIELESLSSQWLAPIADRVRVLGEQLHNIEAELSKRDTAGLSTAQLFTLSRNLRRQIEQITGAVRFTTPVNEIPSDEYHDQVQDWQG